VNRIAFVVASLALGCASRNAALEPSPDHGALEAPIESPLVDGAARRDRAALIRERAFRRGITNSLPLAMIAQAESELSHCLRERPGGCAAPGPGVWECGGPRNPQPVLALGACGSDGGVGLFGIDEGTIAETRDVHGLRVATPRGNADVAIDRLLSILVESDHFAIDTPEQAIAMLGSLTIDGPAWRPYLLALTEGWARCTDTTAPCWMARQLRYDGAARLLVSELGAEFFTEREAPWLSSPLGVPTVNHHMSYPRVFGEADSFRTHACETDRTLYRFHKGVDFAIPRDARATTPVYAAAAGVVVDRETTCQAGDQACGHRWGNFVILAHPNGHSTLYAHLRAGSVDVENGAAVECGQQLGIGGTTGHSTGVHLHFEVRRGVHARWHEYATDPDFVDPWGGDCSTQADDLWIGGAGPTRACGEPTLDGARVIDALHLRRTTATPGEEVVQEWRIRNTGTTTWTAAAYELRHVRGEYGDVVARVALPEGASVAPGAHQDFEIRVTAPAAAGDHGGEWRMARIDGAAFGQTAQLTIRVLAPSSGCDSATLRAMVPDGTCVQVAERRTGCAESCGWFRCESGTFRCRDREACSGAVHPHAMCSAPAEPPDAGMPDSALVCRGTSAPCGSDAECCAGLTCGARTTRERSCCGADRTRCARSSECCGGMSCVSGFCACVPQNQLCVADADCCAGLACIAGACRPADGCGREGTGCASAECCYPLRCSPSRGGGASLCCVSQGVRCDLDSDCCGDMRCVGGRCACRGRGESCSGGFDCCGGLLCSGGTCGG
jgi:hypothetical protein